MKRYHKNIGIPKVHLDRLEMLNEKFNSSKRYGRTKHAFHRLNERFDYISILNHLANKVKFSVKNVFEIYVDNEVIQKVCYKLDYKVSPYESQDLILVLTKDKAIVTLYLNAKGDNHITLKKELYTEVAK